MYERLIQKLIKRDVGAIAGTGTLRPTGGTTYCTVETGKFSNTYDGYTATSCCFKRAGTCLSEWYWDKPVNVTKFNILSLYYTMDSEIYLIWGRVNGSWVELWTGSWQPSHNFWDSKAVSCNNCDGILIGQRHNPQPSRPCIVDVTVDYEEVVPPPPNGEETLTEAVTCRWVEGFRDHGSKVTQFDIDETVYAYAEIALHGQDAYGKIMKHEWWYKGVKRWEWQSTCSSHYLNNWSTWTWWAIGKVHGAGTGYIKIFFDGREMGKTNDFTIVSAEGKASIVSIYKPDNFTPGTQFHIKPKVRNDGESDTLFMGLTDTDTGKVLKDPNIYTFYTSKGTIWEQDWVVKLVQNTDFHGRVDVGHDG